MPPTPTPAGTTSRRRLAVVVVALGLLASACSGGGSDEADADRDATTTTETEDATTTTEADEPEEEGEPEGLPTDEDVAPSGEWISVRAQVASEPEPEDFNPGTAETRLYDIEPDCDDDGCTLEVSGGGDGGTYGMPDTETVASTETFEFEPEGDEWVLTETLDDTSACTEELDGPYLETTEERTFVPHYLDGEIVGMSGTYVVTDALTPEGVEAGCPASSARTVAYVVIAAQADFLDEMETYEVDGTFRETIEVTDQSGHTPEEVEVGASYTTLEDYDIVLEGSCDGADGCEVSYSTLNGDDEERDLELTAEQGPSLSGSTTEEISCYDPETGDTVLPVGAYTNEVAYSDLTPVWFDADGRAQMLVGRYEEITIPTDRGLTEDACSEVQTIEGWAYFVDTSLLDV